MNRQFRIIHFVPDPFSGARIPIGALVRDRRQVDVAIADHLPAFDCLGSLATESLLQGVVEDLRHGGFEFEVLPQKFGPQVRLGEPKSLPNKQSDAIAWLREHVLPKPKKTEDAKSSAKRVWRTTEGKRFLQQHGVAKHVKSYFDPQSDVLELNGASDQLPKVSQWVGGPGGLILMEPLVPRRQSFSKDLTQVMQRFSTYRVYAESALSDAGGALISYILPGGAEEQRNHAFSALEQSAHRVVDGADHFQLDDFIAEIREKGSEGQAAMID